MKRANATLILLILTVTALGAHAMQAPDKLATVARLQSRHDLHASWDADGLRLSPMQREIQAVVDSSRLAEAALQAEFRLAQDDGGALAAKARIARLQRQTQQRVLEIQARYARLAGRQDLLRQIEASLAALLEPAERRRVQTIVRPD